MMSIKSWTGHNRTVTMVTTTVAASGTVSPVREAARVESQRQRQQREVLSIDEAMDLLLPLTPTPLPRKCPRFPNRFCTISSNRIRIDRAPRISSAEHCRRSNSNCWRQRQRSKNIIHQRRIHGIRSNCRHSRIKSTFVTSRFSTRSSTRSNSSVSNSRKTFNIVRRLVERTR